MWLYALYLAQVAIMNLKEHDKDGWPHFKQLKELPMHVFHEQENFLKDHILFYFEQQEF